MTTPHQTSDEYLRRGEEGNYLGSSGINEYLEEVERNYALYSAPFPATDYEINSAYAMYMSSFVKTTRSVACQTQERETFVKTERFLCEMCGCMYANKRNLDRHLRDSHAVASHICTYCTKGFQLPNRLARHIMEQHLV